jgi:RimJ/RimL family protein N-acetyltransferase
MEDPAFDSLKTSRLTIRRFRASDAPAFAAYRNDPEVERYQGWESCSDAEASDFIESLTDQHPGAADQWFQFAIEEAETGQLAGDCGLFCYDEGAAQAELGFTLATLHQRRGYAHEAISAVLEYAFSRLEVHRVHSVTDERNYPAQALLENLGFRIEGRFRENLWFKGEWASERVYALLGEEWTNRDTD